MKKLLMLGGANAQIPAIKKAKDMGHYIILCDTVEDCPGKQYAHEFYNVSTTDKEAVLHLAKSLNIDGIVCYVADSGAPTVAYVAKQLGLPSNPYDSVEILINKEKFRDFQKEHGFNVPKAVGYSSFEEAMEGIPHFNLPVMIKPVDAAGSKGVAKIDAVEQLKEKAENALRHSKTKRFIIEEYIENYYPHVGGDGFSINGQLAFCSLSNEYFSTERLNPFISIVATWPSILPKYLQEKVYNELQKLITLLNMNTCAYNFDIRIDKNENVYLIEVAPRNGGDWNPQAIKYATGIDLIEYTIKGALGEDCSDLIMVEPSGFWVSYILNSHKTGKLKHIEIQEEFKKNNLVEYDLLVQPGDMVFELSGPHEKMGIIILKFSSREEMVQKMDNIHCFIKVILEDSMEGSNRKTNDTKLLFN
ncbi:ATP-grasp domain-containing protein [Lysinibacillus sp. 54212]|uniref:ATP-grasp domain-containing protein n=1 Tax=Lysinibacillus sp. 54212 TaxID=3119829 RepID=UPI002FCBEB79